MEFRDITYCKLSTLLLRDKLGCHYSDGFITASSQRLPGAWRQREIEASHVTESTSAEMWGVVQEAITPGLSVNEIFDIPGCVIQ
jgi:arabinogalactan endo-1,4-beta-galactosidase